MDAAPRGALGTHIARSARWVTTSMLVSTGTTWLTAIALSRLLDRRDFGLAALAMLAVAVFQLFQDSGLHAALIQRPTGVHAAADAASLYAPLTGLVLGGACVAAAPLAALLLHQPAAKPLIAALGAVLFLRSFAIVPTALIQRELLFARVAVISMSGSLLYLGGAVALALAGAGAWSVIGAQVALAGWQAVASWVAAPWRPNPRRASRSELPALLGYGRHIVAGNVVGFVNSNTDPLAVGRLFGPESLGAYTLGFQTGSQSVTAATGVANLLVFPAYAALQDDLERFRNAYLRSLRFICVISPPLGFGLAAVSSVLVPALYGEKWSAAIPVLAIISFYGLTLSVSATTGEVFKAAGRPDLFFRMGVWQVLILFALIGALYPFGIVGFAAARAGATLVMGVVALVMAGRILELALGAWLRALAAPMVSALLMGAGVTGLRVALEHFAGTRGWELAPLIATGAVLYVAALRTLAPARWHEFVADLARIVPPARWLDRRGGRPLQRSRSNAATAS